MDKILKLLNLLGLVPVSPAHIAGLARPPLRYSIDSTNQMKAPPSAYTGTTRSVLRDARAGWPPYMPRGRIGMNQFAYPIPIPSELIQRMIQQINPQG